MLKSTLLKLLELPGWTKARMLSVVYCENILRPIICNERRAFSIAAVMQAAVISPL